MLHLTVASVVLKNHDESSEKPPPLDETHSGIVGEDKSGRSDQGFDRRAM
jgi:hypothetical protein